MPIDIEDDETILKIKKLGMMYCIAEDGEVEIYYLTQQGISPLWDADIYNYLKYQKNLQYFDRNEKFRLKISTLKYDIIGDIPYKKSFDEALTHHEIAKTLEQEHEGLCRGHLFIKVLYTNILHIGYY